jgi:hypothetical protein
VHVVYSCYSHRGICDQFQLVCAVLLQMYIRKWLINVVLCVHCWCSEAPDCFIFSASVLPDEACALLGE